MNTILERRNISTLEHQLMNIEKKLQVLFLKSQKGWAHFQEVLSVSQTEKEYWDKEGVQKEMFNLCLLIDERTEAESTSNPLKLRDFEDLENVTQSFIWGEDQEGLKVDWDFLYPINPSFRKDPPKKTSPLHPEDVFGLLIILDRRILFYRETYRQLKYELIQRRIDAI